MKKHLPTIKKYSKYLLIGILIYLIVRYALIFILAFILGTMFFISDIKNGFYPDSYPDPIVIDSVTTQNKTYSMEYDGDSGDTTIYIKEQDKRKKIIDTFGQYNMSSFKFKQVNDTQLLIHSTSFDNIVCIKNTITNNDSCRPDSYIIDLNLNPYIVKPGTFSY